MEHDPEIRLADVQHLAHFFARYAIHFTHDKDLGRAWREPVETGLHRLPELGTLHRLFALGLPIRRAASVNPVMLAIESIRVFVAEELKVSEARLPAKPSKIVADLVFQNATEPTSLRRAAPEFACLPHGHK